MSKKMTAQEKQYNLTLRKKAQLAARECYLGQLLVDVRNEIQTLDMQLDQLRQNRKFCLNEMEKAMAKTNKIGAIKMVRERYAVPDLFGQLTFPVGLKEAKDMVDNYLASISL